MTTKCQYCHDSGSITMVNGAYTTSFACQCECRGAKAARSVGMVIWQGYEAQHYKGNEWRMMWAKTDGVHSGHGLADHFPAAQVTRNP